MRAGVYTLRVLLEGADPGTLERRLRDTASRNDRGVSTTSNGFDVTLSHDLDGQRVPYLRLHIRNADSEASAVPADFRIRVGRHAAARRAQREFTAADAETAILFLLTLIERVSGNGFVCVDLADLFVAWPVDYRHDIVSAWPDALAGVGRLTVFLLREAGRFSLDELNRVACLVQARGVPHENTLICDVLLSEGERDVDLLVVSRPEEISN